MIRKKAVILVTGFTIAAISLTACQMPGLNADNAGQTGQLAAAGGKGNTPTGAAEVNSNASTGAVGVNGSTPAGETGNDGNMSTGNAEGGTANDMSVDDNTGSTDKSELTPEEMSDKFQEQFYPGLSYEEIETIVMERNSYYRASGYYADVIDYWENVRQVYDISHVIEPLFFTDMKYYTEEDFKDLFQTVVLLAQKEIYAKHGCIFKDEDMNNYFMGCAWYQPVCSEEEFDDSVFNDYEKKNLELLSALVQE